MHAIPQQGMPPSLGPKSRCCTLTSNSNVAGTKAYSVFWQNGLLQTAPLGWGNWEGRDGEASTQLGTRSTHMLPKSVPCVLRLYNPTSDVTWSVTLFSSSGFRSCLYISFCNVLKFLPGSSLILAQLLSLIYLDSALSD